MTRWRGRRPGASGSLRRSASKDGTEMLANSRLLDSVNSPADLRALTPDSLRRVADELRQEGIDAVSVTGGHLGAGLGGPKGNGRGREGVNAPADLRALTPDSLRRVADELRQEVIDAVSVTGGHLGAGLGVVELTVALHYLFDTPDDILIWDVGHQAYPHKILTERRDRIRSLRHGGGLSGFTRRSESEYDPFGAAHSSTSISSGLGMAVARDLQKKDNNVIAVIGDGSMSAGMAYEAMNNAGAMDSRLIVILNDNDMSIAPPVGALSGYLARLISGRTYMSLRDIGMQLAHKMPKGLEKKALRVEEYARGFLTGGTMFEELGFYYVGPIDGHNLEHLLPVLKNVRDAKQGPILIHCVTQKGKGYAPAEKSADKSHAVVKFDVVTGVQTKAKSNAPAYTKVFGESLVKEAQKDDKIVAITAAMPGR